MTEAVVANGSITRKPGAFEKRIHEIDFLRGFLIMLVLMDHLFWCLQNYNGIWMDAHSNVAFFKVMYQIFNFYWDSAAREVVRFFALFGFTFISGVSSAFSRNNWIRAGQMLLVAGLLAVGSNLLDASHLLGDSQGSVRIDFNVIAVLAWSTLFYCFVQNKSWRIILVGVLVMFLLSVWLIPDLYQIYTIKKWDAYVPALWEPDGQADWMPLFPFIFFFFLGGFVSKFVYAEKKSIIKTKGNWERPFCFMGRHSLWIYLGHQVVMLPFFLLLNVFLG